ncbi:MAG: hypothetical protein PHS41_08485 [Victivallaceae bacterium]|nr:hypothetical protein [Victivallaceae bacterium]
MKYSFYDVKSKKKIQAEIAEFVTYGKEGNKRYAFKAKAPAGHNMTAFVSEKVWKDAKKK